MAQRHKLTHKEIDNEKTTKEKWLNDGDDLYLRVRPESKTWIYWFTSPTWGKRRKQSLGTYPTLSLADARVKAEKSRKLVADGIDPLDQAEQDELLANIGEAPRTVLDLFDRWKKGWLVSHHSDKGAYVEGMLTRHAFPLLGKLELERIRAPHITAMLTQLKATGKKRTTAVVLSNLRQMFCYAVECGWMAGDPTAALKKRTWAGPKVTRERTLSEDEIRDLAVKAPKADLAPEIECALWIMLSCLTRVEETGLARLQDVDFEKKTWRIPANNQKKVNGSKPQKDHVIDLSPFALKWFERLRQIPQEHAERRNAKLPKSKRLEVVEKVEVDYLFPATRRNGPFNEKTIAHALNDRQKPGQEPLRGRTRLVGSLVLEDGKWTAHDLRRSGSTLMRELGIPQDVIDRCLNHVEQDVIVSTYQQAQLREEKKLAWLRLGQKLEELTEVAHDQQDNTEQLSLQAPTVCQV